MVLDKKESLTEKIGEEIVDEMLEAGLAILLIIAGVSYFNLENNWTEAAKLIADKVGLMQAEGEISMMYNSVVNGFPFNFISSHFGWSVAVGILLCIIGITIKIITLKTKEEFIKDMGKVILIPGVVGVIAVVLIQILTVNSLNDLFVRTNLATTELMLSKLDTSVMVWNMMGLLFLIGFSSLIFGALLVYVVKALKGKPTFLYILGNFLVFIGWFNLGYYVIVRLMAIDVVASSLYGTNMLKLFAFSWYIARGTFLTALSMFALGFTLYNYGSREIRRKRRMVLMEAKQSQMVLHQRPTHYPGGYYNQ